jgi:hypothetical protein
MAKSEGLRQTLRAWFERKSSPQEIKPVEIVEYAKTKGFKIDRNRASMEKSAILGATKKKEPAFNPVIPDFMVSIINPQKIDSKIAELQATIDQLKQLKAKVGK